MDFYIFIALEGLSYTSLSFSTCNNCYGPPVKPDLNKVRKKNVLTYQGARACLCVHVPPCLACLLAHMPTCLPCLGPSVSCVLRPHLSTCLACLRAHVPTWLVCLRACVLAFQRVLRTYMLT